MSDPDPARPVKPAGWWTTHPTILTVSAHGVHDANGDGMGDFEGIRQKLGFLADLGISGMRFQHVGKYGDDYGYSGLVMQDWFDVDPNYGTMADFDRLMADCKARDMRIMMMVVPEYVGWHHPDYLAAAQARRAGQFDPRINWFWWNDDDTVITCWDRPGLDTSNPAVIDAVLRHMKFWMDKGVCGWDFDAVGTWLGLNLEAQKRLIDFVKSRGGLATAENMVMQDQRTRDAGWNAGNGYIRHQFYNEIEAIVQHKADFIRTGLRSRDELIALGMFPYQQWGDNTYSRLEHSGSWHRTEMFKLQVAFNAPLPDQVWMLAHAMTFSGQTRQTTHDPLTHHYGHIDWDAIARQEQNPASPFVHVRRMMQLRAHEKALAIGHIEELETNHREDVFAALRTSEDGTEQAITIFNFAQAPRNVIVQLGNHDVRSTRNYLNNEQVIAQDNTLGLDLRLYGYKLLKVVR